MPKPEDHKELYELIDAMIRIDEDREEDRILSEKCGISLENAALIRAWWFVHDEREDYALERSEKLEMLRDEGLDEAKSNEVIEATVLKGKPNNRLDRHIQYSLLAIGAAGIFYRYVGHEWAVMWVLFCLFGMLAIIEHRIWQITNPETPTKK